MSSRSAALKGAPGGRGIVRQNLTPLLAFAVSGAGLAILRGRDLNFDLLNARGYLGWSLWTNPDQPFFPASIWTYFVPYLDALQWPLWTLLPWPVAAVVIGMAQGLCGWAVLLIAEQVIPTRLPHRKLYVWSVAVLSLASPIVLSEFGTSLQDLLLSTILLLGIGLLVSNSTVNGSRGSMRFVLAGVLIGSAPALKLTQSPFAIAVLLATWLTTPSVRLVLVTWGAALSSFVLLFLPWSIHTYLATGNPVFPLANGVFESTFFPPNNFRDERWTIKGLSDVTSRMVPGIGGPPADLELPYFDPRFALFWWLSLAVVILAVVERLMSHSRAGTRGYCRERAISSNRRALFVWLVTATGLAVSMLVWGYGRYYITGLTLAPLALVCLSIGLTHEGRAQRLALGSVLIALVGSLLLPLTSPKIAPLLLIDWRHDFPAPSTATLPRQLAPQPIIDSQGVLFLGSEVSYLASSWQLDGKILLGLPSQQPAVVTHVREVVRLSPRVVGVWTEPYAETVRRQLDALKISARQCTQVAGPLEEMLQVCRLSTLP